ncbi:MAG: cytochrome bc complex cytochrome b subunit [Anaerolineales bacterium]|nr:MAG: cytochrome bc complex cytochrome b subunit [Anaerolineales bacterium]
MIKNLSLQDLRSRALELLDQRVRIITAGMGLKELRAVMRGDPPTEKPNPRYRVHITSFIFHIRPRYYQQASTWFTHTFRLGYFTTLFFIIEIITGLILMIYYVPSPSEAYQSILRLEGNVAFGSMLRDLHRLGAEAMVAFAALHMLRTYLTGSYKKERSFTWLTGVLLLLITLFLSFSGYLLPWDQLAYWAVTIGTSMAESAPLFGNEVNLLLRGAPDIGAGGLLRFYLLHVVLVPLLGIVVLSIHYYKVSREHNISLPARIEEGDLPKDVKKEATQRIDFIPDLLTHEVFLACLTIFAMVVMVAFFYNAPLEHHADPQKTPLDTKAPWYFLWIQGMLKLGDPTLMGVILPTVIFALLFAVPYIDRNPYRMMSKRPVAVTLGLLFVAAVLVLSYMGTPGYGIETPAAIRIVQDLAPEEGVGALREISFEQLEPGIYEVGKTDTTALPPELGLVFIEFERRVNEAEEAGKLPGVQAVMIIEDWQAGLKKVTPRIIWSDPESGDQKTFEKHIFLHRDRGLGGE